MSSDVCDVAAKAGLREEAGVSHVIPKEHKTVVSRGRRPLVVAAMKPIHSSSLSGVYLLELMCGGMDRRCLDSRLLL